MRVCLILAGVLALIVPDPVHAVVELLEGVPAHHRFEPDIQVFPQNFDIARDESGLVYIASYSGVLVYDGERWELVEVAGAGAARVVKPDNEGRVYVGGIGALGYIEHDQAGIPVFHDLTAQAAELLGEEEAIGDVWQIELTPHAVFFDAGQTLFAYRPELDEFENWRTEERFGGMVFHAGQLWIHQRGKGLSVLDNDGELVLISSGSDLDESVVWSLTPLDEQTLLIQMSDGRWKQVDDSGVSIHNTPEDFPGANRILDIQRLSNDSLVMAGSSGNIYIYWPGAHRFRSFRLAGGAVVGLHCTQGHGLLAVTDLAAFSVTWPAAWTVLGEDTGLIGQVMDITQWKDDLVVLTDVGVYRLESDDSGHAGQLSIEDWTQLESWDWLSLSEERALLADSYHVLELDRREGRASKAVDTRLDPIRLYASPHYSNRVYVGLAEGLAVLQEDDGDWELLLKDDEQMIRVVDVLEPSPGELWLATLGSGLWRVQLDEQGRSVRSRQELGPEQGLLWDRRPEVVFGRIGDVGDEEVHWLVGTDLGFYHWVDDHFAAFDDDLAPDAELVGDVPLQIERSPDGGLWAWNHHQVLRREFSEDAKWRVKDVAPLRRGGISSAWFGSDGSALFGASSSIMMFNPGEAETVVDSPDSPFEIVIRRVSRVVTGEEPEPLSLDPEAKHRFAQEEFGMRFEFTVPDLNAPDEVVYQERLVGLEGEFVPWSSTARVTYFNLDPGSYRFKVRGRDSTGHVSEAQPFDFVILPPWYRTTWAITIWVFLVLTAVMLLVAGIVRWRVARLAADKQRLEQEVDKRTRELSEANERLEAMAHVDGLTGLANRHRLDHYLELMGPYCRREKVPMSVLLIDVDEFKNYNDRRGHLEGDRYLNRLAEIMQRLTRRKTDLVARYGGEEFLIVLPNTDQDAARDLAEGLRREVADSELETTISVGVATLVPTDADDIRKVIKEADQALYQAKRSGKNQVRVADGGSD